MKLFFDNKASEIIQAKVGNLVDNDFLGQVFHDEEVLKETLILFSEKRIYLYPFTPHHNAPLVRARVKKKAQSEIPQCPDPLRQIEASRKVVGAGFTEFEFLRDVFTQPVRELKEQFIAKPIFGHIKQENHLKIFPKLYENALLLSKVYAHQGHAGTSGFVDLLLAGFLMYLVDKATLITGNKKHFPSCVFDTLSVLNIEQNDDNMRTFCIIAFNQGKFNSCLDKLQKVKGSP